MNEIERELYLYADNNATLYHAMIVPTVENLNKKVERGLLDEEKALISFMKIATVAAKSYHMEHGTPEVPWFKIFNLPCRRTVAQAMLENFKDSVKELGLD